MKVLFFLSALFLATTNAIEVSKGQIPPTRAAFEAVMKNAKPETEEQANRRKPNAGTVKPCNSALQNSGKPLYSGNLE